jgi:hypothetical protein
MSTFPEDQAHQHELGKLIAEFRDFRAGIPKAMGYTFGALGIVLLAGSMLSLPPKFLFNNSDIELAFYLIIAGAVFLVVGKFLQNKRLAIYQDGIAQINWGKVDSLLWRDVRQIRLEHETRYRSGLACRVLYHCSLQRSDGTWLALNAIPVTSRVMKVLRERLESEERGPRTASVNRHENSQ